MSKVAAAAAAAAAAGTEAEDGFEEPKFQKSHAKRKNLPRLYIGNLPPNNNDDPSEIKILLLQLLKDKVPELTLSLSDIDITRKSSNCCHAFVSGFSSNPELDDVISSLHQHVFQSRSLTVQREQKAPAKKIEPANKKKGTNNKAGFPKKKSNSNYQQPPSNFGKSSWSKPKKSKPQQPQQQSKSMPQTTPQKSILKHTTANENHPDENHATATGTVVAVSEILTEELTLAAGDHNNNDNNDVLNAALAGLAAVSFLAPVLNDDETNFMEEDITPYYKDDKETTTIPASAKRGVSWGMNQADATTTTDHDNNNNDKDNNADDDQVTTMDDFRSRCQQPLSALLADEYGDYDPDWKALQPTFQQPQQQQTQADEAPEHEAPEESPFTTTTNSNMINRLGQHGKAPIHVEFNSFGFDHAGISPALRDKAGWSHALPLPLLDVSHCVPVPGYLQWRDGTTGHVQRVLMQADPRLEDLAHEWATQVADAIYEAITEGHHGYASPLQMKVYAGSDAGRHRSVVVCEQAAKRLRKVLRQQEETSPQHISCPVSVGTFHRDVEKAKQHRAAANKKQKDDSDW